MWNCNNLGDVIDPLDCKMYWCGVICSSAFLTVPITQKKKTVWIYEYLIKSEVDKEHIIRIALDDGINKKYRAPIHYANDRE